MYCTKCGTEVKDDARFCHSCGNALAVEGDAAHPAEQSVIGPERQSWLHSFGIYLLIPVFAGVVVLLFWVNRDPVPLEAEGANPRGGEQMQAPDMAAMQQVHSTLQRLKSKIEADPNDTLTLDSLAIMYSIAGRHDIAIEYYERYLKVDPDNRQIKIALAESQHRIGKTDLAIASIQAILEKEPDYAIGIFYLGEFYASTERIEDAEAQFQKLIEKYPGSEFAKAAEQRLHQLSHVTE